MRFFILPQKLPTDIAKEVRNMETEIGKTADNSYSESDNIPKEKEVNPLKICLIIFIIFIGIPVYLLFSYLGLFPVPKAVMITNFYVNKKHFERMVSSEYSKQRISADTVTDDKDLQKSINTLFKFNIWDHMDRERDNFCVFTPYNFTYIRGRGILYDDGKNRSTYRIEYGRYIFTYKCEPLGGGWYYYEFAQKEKDMG